MNAEQRQRTSNAVTVLGHPHNITGHNAGHDAATEQLDVYEGTHYSCLASTTYSDYFMPTIVHWELGGEEYVDDFSDISQSKQYKQEAIAQHG